MEMLPNYARALWNAAHHLGLNQLLRVIRSVFKKRGIPQPCSPSQSQQTQELEARLKELQDSIGHDHDDADVVEELAALHAAIWAADYADYTMQAIIAVLDTKLGQSQTHTRIECPDGWLEAEANALHAHYAPEEYQTLEGEVQRVERQHTRMHTMLQAWITECSPASAAAHNPTIPRHDQHPHERNDDTAERQDDAVVEGQDEAGVEYEPQEAFALIPDDPVLAPAQTTPVRRNRLGLGMIASAGAAVAVGMTLYMLRPPSADAVAESMPLVDARQQARMRGYAYVYSRLHPL